MRNLQAIAAILDADGRAITGAEWLTRKPSPVKPDITLANGTVITHAPMANGATEAIVMPDGRAMTDADSPRVRRIHAGELLLEIGNRVRQRSPIGAVSGI